MATLSEERVAQLSALLERIGLPIDHLELYNCAFTHSSYLNERGMDPWEGNERLEFLGDAVVGLVVSDQLYRSYPDWPEGHLSKIKSVVVSRKILARQADRLKLGEGLLLGVGEGRSGGHKRLSILSALYECLVGALYLAHGLAEAQKLIYATLNDEINQAVSGESVFDHKSLLQERVQQSVNLVPRYRVVHTSGPDHDKTFRVEALLKGIVLGYGEGHSKKGAEQNAAANALARLENESLDVILEC